MWWRRRPRRGEVAVAPRHAPAVGDAALIDASELLRHRSAIWDPRFRGRGISLACSFEVSEPLLESDETAVIGDALLSNALRFSDHGDHVCVTLRISAGVIEVQVSDSGMGVPPEDLPRIFERGYRGSIGRDDRWAARAWV